jgi:hypothetical protein
VRGAPRDDHFGGLEEEEKHMGAATNRRAGVLTAACAAAAIAASTSAFAADVFYVGPASGGTWDSDANWRGVGVDATFNTGDDTFVQPTTADNAVIFDGQSVDLSSTETITELQMSRGNVGSRPQTAGIAQLNVLPGANLQTSGGGGFRIGRVVQAGAAVGDNVARVIQSGGLMQVGTGTNGVRLSQSDAGTLADSLYEISGGSVRGGPTNGSMTGPLQIGIVSSTFGTAEFHIVGTGPTEMRFEDVRMQANSTGAGDAILHFSIGASGVTPLIAEDEMRFSGVGGVVGDNLLVVDLIGAAPESDITLITADRLGVSNAPAETFTGLPDLSPISAVFGGFQWNWLVDYTDGSDDFQTIGAAGLDASVVLRFQSKVAVPEPGSLALLGLGGLAMMRRRTRR